MTVGALGDIVFYCDLPDLNVMTDYPAKGSYESQVTKEFYVYSKGTGMVSPSDMNLSGSVRVANHDLLGGNQVMEPVGRDADKLSFKLLLSMDLGIDPQTYYAKLVTYERNFTPLTFVLGDKAYGRNKWLITNHSASLSNLTDAKGNVRQMEVGVDLVEYLPLPKS